MIRMIDTIFLVCYLALVVLPCSSSPSSSTSFLSCGDLHNIKCPFALEGNPNNCDYPYSLTCRNNQTIYYIWPKEFYVTDISYENMTMRIVDPGLQRGNCSSMPRYSLTNSSFTLRLDDIQMEGVEISFEPYISLWSINLKAIIYMNCSTTVVDSPRYVNTSPCIPMPESRANHTYYLYVVVDPLVSDYKSSCNDSLMTWISTDRDRDTYTSYSDIHNEMVNGFYLHWRPHTSSQSRFVSFLTALKLIVVAERLTIAKFIGYLAGRSVFWMCLLGFLFYTLRRRHQALDGRTEDFLYIYRKHMPTRYTYKDVKRMTKGFEEKLGQGGFGSVFKGFMRNNRPVAIKVLSTAKGNGQDFINEVATIGRIHHVNVVQLIGFVVERSKQALIYEFMPNGSLDKYIFPQKGSNNHLSWEKTYEIALGIARGIEYLHRGCNMQILHFDIKPHNILLDDNYIPKISDFGLAKLCSMDDSIVSVTAARGTIGYMAPEFFYRSLGGVSYKSDVYSFGKLLMEMVGRRKNLDISAENSRQTYFPSWIYDRVDHVGDIETVDATVEESEIAKKMIIVALWCIQMKPIDRPSMTKVVEMLEGTLELLEMPPKPSFAPDLLPDGRENDTSSTEMLEARTPDLQEVQAKPLLPDQISSLEISSVYTSYTGSSFEISSSNS